jgi:D-3-phosphoglycerate dehydrogenase
MFLMLAAAKSGILLDQAVRRGDFAARSRVLGIELLGLTLFIVGFGRIGQLVAARARAFGLRILAFDPYVDGNQFSGVSFVESPEEGLPQANFLSLHVPLLPETRHLIGARQLDLLPEGAIVLNLARGGLIDESALLRRVQTGRLYGAGLDTFEKEPLPTGASIATEERIVLSPHSAALTENSLIAMGVVTVQNVLAGLDGSIDPELVVNKAILPEKGNVKL